MRNIIKTIIIFAIGWFILSNFVFVPKKVKNFTYRISNISTTYNSGKTVGFSLYIESENKAYKLKNLTIEYSSEEDGTYELLENDHYGIKINNELNTFFLDPSTKSFRFHKSGFYRITIAAKKQVETVIHEHINSEVDFTIAIFDQAGKRRDGKENDFGFDFHLNWKSDSYAAIITDEAGVEYELKKLTKFGKKGRFLIKVYQKTDPTNYYSTYITIDNEKPTGKLYEVVGDNYQEIKSATTVRNNVVFINDDFDDIDRILLNGIEYISGTLITEKKRHEIYIYDKIGNYSRYSFTIR